MGGVGVGDAEARQHRGKVEATVKPLAKLRRLPWPMLWAGLAVRTGHRGLHVSAEGVASHVLGPLDAGRAATGHPDLVLDPGVAIPRNPATPSRTTRWFPRISAIPPCLSAFSAPLDTIRVS